MASALTITLPDDLFFTPPEIARLLKVSRAKAYQLVKTGQIKGISIGTQPRVPRASLLAYLQTTSGSYSYDTVGRVVVPSSKTAKPELC